MKTFKFLVLAVCCVSFTLSAIPASAQGEVTKELQLESFHSIGLSTGATVNLYKGSAQKVVVKGSEKAIEKLNKEVKNGSWNIGFGNEKSPDYKGMVIDITLPTVKGLSIAGSGKIVGHDSFDGLESLAISLAGSGDVEFSGSAGEVKVSIAGSGNVRTAGLKAKTCKVSISGSGDCEVEVSDDLNVSIAGSGDVKYKGNPKVKTSVAGSGSVQSM
jgi:hypothetical protein